MNKIYRIKIQVDVDGYKEYFLLANDVRHALGIYLDYYKRTKKFGAWAKPDKDEHDSPQIDIEFIGELLDLKLAESIEAIKNENR